MSSITYARGATLLELMIAVAMVSAVVAMIAVLFPKASQSISSNRRRWLASNFADAKIHELTALPYAKLTPTPPSLTYFSSIAITAPPGGCDCSQVTPAQWANIPNLPDGNMMEDSITYTRQVCIHLVRRNAAAGWDSICPDPATDFSTDTGLMNIRVRVSWTLGTDTFSAEAESLVTR